MTATRRPGPPVPRTGGPVITLDDPAAADPSVAGRKAATLARLRAAGYPVSAGIVVTVTAADPDEGLLAAMLRELGSGPVAVRSSSPTEDGAVASAAGRYLTVLGVPPREPDVAGAVRRVRGSAAGAPMAVLIQPMIGARAAGVAFGADPVTGDTAAVHISAVRGLADRLVSGTAEADQWTVTGDAAQCRHRVDGAITGAEATRIAHLVVDLGAREGSPQDVEWAIDGDGLQLVQCRPITALPVPPQIDLPPGTWVSDGNRYPDGMTPFGMSVAAGEVSRGLTAVFTRCGALVERVEMRGVAGRPYLQFVPVGGRTGTPPPGPVFGVLARVVPALRQRCRRARRLLESGELGADIERWNSRDRRQARDAADDLLAVDVTALPDAALAAHLEQVIDVVRRGLSIHFRLMAPYLIGVYGLIQACQELLGWPRARTLGMLAGLSPASDEPTRKLTAIARRIAASDSARAAVLGGGEDGHAGIRERLRAAAPDLADAVDTWCGAYGLRTVNDDPGSPTLIEIPGLLERLFADQVRQHRAGHHTADGAGTSGSTGAHGAGTSGRTGDEDSGAPSVSDVTVPPDAVRARAAAAVACARSELAGRSAADRRRFEDALATASAAYPVREDNVLWALSVPSGLARRAAVEIGGRLRRRGEIDDPRDVVMLGLDTVLAAIRGAAEPGSLRPVIARARAERAWVASHPLPESFGPPPGPMPDLRFLPRAARFVNEALQLDSPAATGRAAADADALLSGVPGSPGRHTGPVRILRGPADFAVLRRGDVLVCAVTDPAWSVLFGVAGAVVTDGGGVLTHSAIIAREHGIPAVLGTGSATRSLQDGQLVTVDGTHGTVLDAEQEHDLLAAEQEHDVLAAEQRHQRDKGNHR